MAEEAQALTGGCMCGAVRYETSGTSHRVIHCYCESCRKHTGAPAVTLAVFKVDQVAFSGEARKVYASSPGVGRAFCGDCGSPLTWETELGSLGPVCALHISSFDDPEALRPDSHSFYPERYSWFDIADELPRYEAFVGGGVLICHGPAGSDSTK